MRQQAVLKLTVCAIAVALASAQPVFAAANFSVTPFGALPTTVTPGQTVSAYFTVTNMTNTARDGYVVTGLPTTVTQNTTAPNCTNPINLAAHASCQLQFDITGAVSANFALCKGNSCTTATTPLGVSASTAPSTLSNLAYITQSSGDPVMVCSVDSINGSLSACQPAGGGSVLVSAEPQGIVLNAAHTFAYVTGSGGSSVYQCPINPDTGLFDTCTESTITSPMGYTAYYGFLSLNADDTVAYVVDDDTSNGRVLSCPVSSNTIQASCTDVGVNVSLVNEAVGIVLNALNTVAYIGNYFDGTVATCTVAGNTFSACGLKTGDGDYFFSEPAGVALNSAGTSIYVADNGNDTIFLCDTTASSTSATTFNLCNVAASPATNPWGITLNAANTYAYVTDHSTTVYVCHIAIDGTFDVCTANATFTQPVGIALTN